MFEYNINITSMPHRSSVSWLFPLLLSFAFRIKKGERDPKLLFSGFMGSIVDVSEVFQNAKKNISYQAFYAYLKVER